MNAIIDTVFNYLPYKRRQTPSGWVSFNAVCCLDKRYRGGVIVDGDAVSYHCFNCGFKASWQPGRTISAKMRKLLVLLNVPDDLISKMSLEALKYHDETPIKHISNIPNFETRTLPRGAELIGSFLDDPPDEIIPVLEHCEKRKLNLNDYDFYWTPEEGFNNRLIIPFYYKGRIVGYTARRIDDGRPKYLSEQQPGYVFNLDNQNTDRQFIILCEGPIDAIMLDGIAVMGTDINSAQYELITQLRKEIIVVPDRDSAGSKLVTAALNYNWNVSFPDWDDSIKDINDAVIKYGKLSTLISIKKYAVSSEIKIKLISKDWFK